MPHDDSFYIDYTNRHWDRWNREDAFYDSMEANSFAAALRRPTSRTAHAEGWDADDVGDLTYEVSGSIYFCSTDPYRGYQVKCDDCGQECHAMGLHRHRLRFCSHRLAEDAKPLPSRLEFRTLQRRWYEWRHFVGLRPIRELTAQAIAKQAAMKAVQDGSEDLTYEVSGSIYFTGTDHYQYFERKCVDCGKVCRARDLHQHRSHFCQQWVDKAEDPLPSRLEFRTLQRCWDVWSVLLEHRLVRKFRAQALATEAPTKARKKKKKKKECQHPLEDLAADSLHGQGYVGGPSSADVSPLPLSVSPQSAVVEEDISDSDCDPSRSSTQAFRLAQDLKVLGQTWSHWLQLVEKRRRYSDSCSYDSFLESDSEDDIWWRNHMVCQMIDYEAQLTTTRARNPWRTACHITVDEADTDGTWELPSLTAADCPGELEMIRYAVCSSTMAFEESAAAAVSQERYVSLAGYLERARFASQLASAKDYCEHRRNLLRRRHTMTTPPAKCSTKRGRRQHQQELRRARSHRKSRRTGVPRPAQPAVQFCSPFSFGPPTAPTIPLAASKGVFTFGAAVRSNPSIHRPANLSIEPRAPGRDTGSRPAFTTQPGGPKPHRTRCKLNDVTPGLGLVQPDTSSSLGDDSPGDDSDRASAASTVPLLFTLLSLMRGARGNTSRHRGRKTRHLPSSWQLPQLSATETVFGRRHRKCRRHSPRCTRALIKALGRSRWLNGLCRCLHSGCTDGSGPRPSIEP